MDPHSANRGVQKKLKTSGSSSELKPIGLSKSKSMYAKPYKSKDKQHYHKSLSKHAPPKKPYHKQTGFEPPRSNFKPQKLRFYKQTSYEPPRSSSKLKKIPFKTKKSKSMLSHLT